MSERIMKAERSSQTNNDSTDIRVWDLPTRVFHWLLVSSFAGAWLTNELGPTYFTYHVWAGYFVVVLVSFRLLWGVLGTHHAKFANFIRHPKESFRYAAHLVKRKPLSYAGHNPLGAWMVLLLLGLMLIQAATGLFTNDEIFNVGPLYGYVSNDVSLWLTQLHKDLFNWILVAVGLHVAAVLLYVIFKKENLVKAMITGKKPNKAYEGAHHIDSSKVWLALVLIVIVSAVLAAIIVTAPFAEMDLGY
jgi:cytochrome b